MSIIAWLSSILLASCGIPELYKTIKQGKCGIGYGMLITWYLGEIFGLIYVIYLGNYPLTANYLLNTCIITILWYYKLYPQRSDT